MPLYDVAAFQPPVRINDPYVAALATINTSGRYVTGVEKLTQRFLLELLTDKGSIPFNTSRGSIFVASLRGGAVLSEIDIATVFYAALVNITDNLQSEESSTDDAEERYGSAELLKVAVGASSIELTIIVRSLANKAASLTFPFSFTPSPINGTTVFD